MNLLHWAIGQLTAAGIERPRFEAQLLLADALGVSRSAVIAGTCPEPSGIGEQEFRALVSARTARVPVAYLRGVQEFYGLPFCVEPGVLVPRPETELLVEFALERLARRPSATVADVGAGSGCIAVSIAAHAPAAHLIAIDVSATALAIARRNVARNRVYDRVACVRGNLLAIVRPESLDIVVSNPPYIPTAEVEDLEPEVRDWEPRIALDGGADGLCLHRQLIEGAVRALRPGGWLAVETAAGQAPEVAALMRQCGLMPEPPLRDLAGIERVVIAEKQPEHPCYPKTPRRHCL